MRGHLLAAALALVAAAACEAPAQRDSRDAGAKQFLPHWYVSPLLDAPPVIDGRIDDPAWQTVPWTEEFADIEGARRPTPRFRTLAKIGWDEKYLYLAAKLEEPHVWGTLRTHDQIVFHDNDFEVFIDPDGDRHQYYELEINALGTIFDLLLEKTYIEGGPARHEWNLDGLQSGVFVDGTLNAPGDEDRGWSVEMALPWRALAEHARRTCPPQPGDVWRINFSRVEWRHRVTRDHYEKIPNTPEDNWVWSPQGAINMHLPHMWGYLEFR